MGHTARELAAELKNFLTANTEDDFIVTAAVNAAASSSPDSAQALTGEEHQPSVQPQAGQPAHAAKESSDVLTVSFQRETQAAPRADLPAEQPVASAEASHTPAPEAPMTTEEKISALAELAETIKKCRRCPLGSTRLNAVPGEGNPNARLMFVGEGPGFDEDRQGRPFVGRAGQLLDKMIAAMGLKREEVFIANIAKCHPMTDPSNPDLHGNDRAPNAGEIASCRKYLEQQIAIILPEYIVALGGVSAKALISDAKSLGALRGKFHNLHLDTVELKRPVKILATYHPAALLRNPGWKKDAWADLQMVMAEMGLKRPQ